MIVSHSHRFIFIKTRKPAGTTVEIALSRYLADGDVVTPISPDDEELRAGLGYPGPRNDLIPVRRYTARQVARAVRRGRRERYANHTALRDLRRTMSAREFDDYTKFTIERNSWDREVSMYWWHTKPRPGSGSEPTRRPSMLDYIRTIKQFSNLCLYTIDDEVAVDRVCRYEELEDDLADLMADIGVGGTIDLPKAKSQFRLDRRPLNEVLGEEERELIADRCRREIAEFGYTFPTN